MVLARVAGTPERPRTIRLHGDTKNQFDIQWYDPLTGKKIAAGPIARTASTLDQTGTFVSEYALVFIYPAGLSEERSFTAVEI